MKVQVLLTQSCPTLCDPMDCSLPGFSVHRIFQARVPEWVAISFSRGSSRDQTQVSHMWADTLPFERLSSGKLMKRRVNWSSKLQCCLILKNCQTCPSATTTLISQPTSHWGKTLYQQKASKKTGWSLRWWLAMKWLASFFSNEAFLKSV